MGDMILKNDLTMTSKEISELTGKAHKHVLRDIRMMCEELEVTSAEIWAHIKTPMPKGGYRETEVYVLDKRLTFVLLTRYSFTLADKVVSRWLELEDLLLARQVKALDLEKIDKALLPNRNVATTKQVGKVIQDIDKLNGNLSRCVPEILKLVRKLSEETL